MNLHILSIPDMLTQLQHVAGFARTQVLNCAHLFLNAQPYLRLAFGGYFFVGVTIAATRQIKPLLRQRNLEALKEKVREVHLRDVPRIAINFGSEVADHGIKVIAAVDNLASNIIGVAGAPLFRTAADGVSAVRTCISGERHAQSLRATKTSATNAQLIFSLLAFVGCALAIAIYADKHFGTSALPTQLGIAATVLTTIPTVKTAYESANESRKQVARIIKEKKPIVKEKIDVQTRRLTSSLRLRVNRLAQSIAAAG